MSSRCSICSGVVSSKTTQEFWDICTGVVMEFTVVPVSIAMDMFDVNTSLSVPFMHVCCNVSYHQCYPGMVVVVLSPTQWGYHLCTLVLLISHLYLLLKNLSYTCHAHQLLLLN